MARTALTDARIGALRPRKIAYDIRDGKLGGFGVRVLPSGRKRFFVHSQHVNGGGNMYRRGGVKMYHGLGGSLSA